MTINGHLPCLTFINVYQKQRSMTSYTGTARYLDKINFDDSVAKKLQKFRTGAKCTKFLKFMSIIDNLHYMMLAA